MRRHRIRRFIIHILPVNAINPELFDVPPAKCAIIVCTNRTNSYINIFPAGQRCIVPFADYEIRNCYGAINNSHARIIIKFLKRLPRRVTDLYICCSKGGSRSPAVAAAVLRLSSRSDRAVWDNPCYVPNWLVYQTICKEGGLFAPDWYVKHLVKRNRRCYLRSVKRGNTGKYERWQIIE